MCGVLGYTLACRRGGRYRFNCNMQTKEKKKNFRKCTFILTFCYRVFAMEERKVMEEYRAKLAVSGSLFHIETPSP